MFTKFSSKFLFTLLISINIGSVFASQSGGVRGGGTGVTCDNKSAVTIEEFEAYRLNMPILLPTDRNEIEQWVRNFISNDELYENWHKIWTQNGHYDSWETIEKKTFNKIRDVKQFKTGFEKLGLNIEKTNFELENDDKYPVPKNCKKISLSLFQEGKILKTENQLGLSELSKRALELHESFYMLGTNNFGHYFPIKTQKLVTELLSSPKPSGKILDDYSEIQKNNFTHLTGIYASLGGLQSYKVRCPDLIIYIVESDNVASETFVTHKEDLNLTTIETRMVNFPLKETKIREVRSHYEFYDYTLSNHRHEGLHLKRDIKDNVRSDASCSYSKQNVSTQKAQEWNRVILNAFSEN